MGSGGTCALAVWASTACLLCEGRLGGTNIKYYQVTCYYILLTIGAIHPWGTSAKQEVLRITQTTQGKSITETTQHCLGITQNYLKNPIDLDRQIYLELLRKLLRITSKFQAYLGLLSTTQIYLAQIRLLRNISAYLGNYLELLRNYLGISLGNYLGLLRKLLRTTQNYLELLRNYLELLRNYLELLRNYLDLLRNYLELLRKLLQFCLELLRSYVGLLKKLLKTNDQEITQSCLGKLGLLRITC